MRGRGAWNTSHSSNARAPTALTRRASPSQCEQSETSNFTEFEKAPATKTLSVYIPSNANVPDSEIRPPSSVGCQSLSHATPLRVPYSRAGMLGAALLNRTVHGSPRQDRGACRESTVSVSTILKTPRGVEGGPRRAGIDAARDPAIREPQVDRIRIHGIDDEGRDRSASAEERVESVVGRRPMLAAVDALEDAAKYLVGPPGDRGRVKG